MGSAGRRVVETALHRGDCSPKTDDEEQEFALTGICRAADVTIDKTVLSTQLYDLALQKNHKGAVKDTTQRGWLAKLLDLLNPF